MRKLALTLFAVPFLALLFALPAGAVTPDEILDDPVLEQRARDISAGLRCLVCQNQSIDDSDAELAKDLRVLVRQRLVVGDSDNEVIGYVVSRYGEFVLLKPRLSSKTIVLWAMPVILLAVGFSYLLLGSRRRRTSASATVLSVEEQSDIKKILGSREGDQL